MRKTCVEREVNKNRQGNSDYFSAAANKSSYFPDTPDDPLDALIDPLSPPPPPKIKARRGEFSFSSDTNIRIYEPKMEDDCDQTLEATRDHLRWGNLGAERLRSAGFTEEEMKKCEKGGEKTEEDVKWKPEIDVSILTTRRLVGGSPARRQARRPRKTPRLSRESVVRVSSELDGTL